MQEYPSDWDKRRKIVYKRDNYTCQNCGRKGGPMGQAELHAHHVVPKSKGGTHRVENLQTVCKECHDAIHGRRLAPTARISPSSSITISQNNVALFIALFVWIFGFMVVGAWLVDMSSPSPFESLVSLGIPTIISYYTYKFIDKI